MDTYPNNNSQHWLRATSAIVNSLSICEFNFTATLWGRNCYFSLFPSEETEAQCSQRIRKKQSGCPNANNGSSPSNSNRSWSLESSKILRLQYWVASRVGQRGCGRRRRGVGGRWILATHTLSGSAGTLGGQVTRSLVDSLNVCPWTVMKYRPPLSDVIHEVFSGPCSLIRDSIDTSKIFSGGFCNWVVIQCGYFCVCFSFITLLISVHILLPLTSHRALILLGEKKKDVLGLQQIGFSVNCLRPPVS